MKIGIFDSGIGGLTVLHQAMITLPEEDYLYYADTDHVPYGIRPKEEILEFVDDALRFMLKKGVKAVIIACNTATSAAIQTLRSRYTIPIRHGTGRQARCGPGRRRKAGHGGRYTADPAGKKSSGTFSTRWINTILWISTPTA